MKLDILAFGAHPDDVEMSCGGTILKHIKEGYKVGIVTLTKGQLGTRGSSQLRMKESEKAAKILGIHANINLGFKDGEFANDKIHQAEVVKMIRQYQPTYILANSPSDRHPDHGKAAKLIYDANFLSGLLKFKTKFDEKLQKKWRAKMILNYIQDYYHPPNIVFDITNFVEKKMEAVLAYSSQFYNSSSNEKEETPISTKQFLEFLKARMREMGNNINSEFAEGFVINRIFGVKDINQLF